MKKIYKFYWDCERMGDLDGMFIADEQDIENAMGKQVCFGEVLGKHSEIYGPLEERDLKVISDDQEFIAKFIEIIGDGTICGYNPLDYIEGEDDDD